MPIYEYVCEDCSKKFEIIRSISQADDAVACSGCSSLHTRRSISKCFSKVNGTSESSTSYGGCNNCSGGNCSHCGH
ncbi:MAG: zinc ribbon domain-containing protein [Flexilinea sp.]